MRINGGFTTGQTYTIDNTAPTISVGAPSVSIARGGPVSYAVKLYRCEFRLEHPLAGKHYAESDWQCECDRGSGGLGDILDGDAFWHHAGDGSLGISVGAGDGGGFGGASTVRQRPDQSATFTVDNTAPTISLSGPSAALTIGGPVTYTVTYGDVNFNSSTLSPADVTLNTTGTATGLVSVSGSGMTRTVTLSGITGDGTVGISIAAGTATDAAGNAAPNAGPSATFTVDNTAATVVSISRLTPVGGGGQGHQPDLGE